MMCMNLPYLAPQYLSSSFRNLKLVHHKQDLHFNCFTNIRTNTDLDSGRQFPAQFFLFQHEIHKKGYYRNSFISDLWVMHWSVSALPNDQVWKGANKCRRKQVVLLKETHCLTERIEQWELSSIISILLANDCRNLKHVNFLNNSVWGQN